MKKSLIALSLLTTTLAVTPNIFAQTGLNDIISNLSQDKVAQGLKEALDKGIEKQVSKLTQKDGFYKNDLVKILLPEEVQKVDQTLRSIGMGNIADQGILLINRAAEDAVKEATPIFIDAVKNMTFNDAKNILLNGDSAATNYLKSSTSKALYSKFSPVIQQSLSSVGADKIWENIFTTYNNLPLVTPVSTNLTDYVTNQTMDGVFKMIAVEENNIRENIGGSRSSNLLQEVFGTQDNAVTSSKNNSTKEKNTQKKKSIFDLFKK